MDGNTTASYGEQVRETLPRIRRIRGPVYDLIRVFVGKVQSDNEAQYLFANRYIFGYALKISVISLSSQQCD